MEQNCSMKITPVEHLTSSALLLVSLFIFFNSFHTSCTNKSNTLGRRKKTCLWCLIFLSLHHQRLPTVIKLGAILMSTCGYSSPGPLLATSMIRRNMKMQIVSSRFDLFTNSNMLQHVKTQIFFLNVRKQTNCSNRGVFYLSSQYSVYMETHGHLHNFTRHCANCSSTEKKNTIPIILPSAFF